MPAKGVPYRPHQRRVLTALVAVATVFFIAGRSSAPAGGSDAGGAAGFAPRALHLRADLSMEVWARGDRHPDVAAIAAALAPAERRQLEGLCGRTLYHGLENVVVSHELGRRTFFATGDLPLMWIRDSAFQIGVLLPKMARRPALRPVIEGAIRTQAFYILQDPYANGFYPEWRHPADHNDGDRPLGRGGWVGVRNYELDSGAYFLNLLWNYANTPGVYAPEALLGEPLVFHAVDATVDTWVVEQRHNDTTSPYRFSELGNAGLGSPVGYTGLIWSGFRPSDDANTYGFSIPSNMYAAGALQRVLELNRAVWRSPELAAKAGRLLAEVEAGLARWAVVEPEGPGGPRVYAYEVDGLGKYLADFDDPNWPSLVAMPLLGWAEYDHAVYAATRARLLSPVNKYWFEGEGFKGMGSPHTQHGLAWALGTLSEALTAPDPTDAADKLRLLLKLQCGDGLMHESIDVNNLTYCTRRWFEWANALAAVAAEHLAGLDCDAAAEVAHRGAVARREGYGPGASDAWMAMAHQGIEAAVAWDVKYQPKVEDWKGIGWSI